MRGLPFPLDAQPMLLHCSGVWLFPCQFNCHEHAPHFASFENLQSQRYLFSKIIFWTNLGFLIPSAFTHVGRGFVSEFETNGKSYSCSTGGEKKKLSRGHLTRSINCQSIGRRHYFTVLFSVHLLWSIGNISAWTVR